MSLGLTCSELVGLHVMSVTFYRNAAECRIRLNT